MKEYLTHPVFKIVSRIAANDNLEVYVIGGFVRDLLLKRASKDIDIVCVGSGIDLAKKVAKAIGSNCVVSEFKNFGTAMLRYEDTEIEFVGARRESYRSNSRKPIVENGTLEDDQLRRDFTINAMAISLHPSDYGRLVDPFGGINDLDNKIIRTPLDPDITFSDDPLRMLRGIRFSTQLGFKIEDSTYQALSRNKQRIEIISQERIVDELNKILMAAKPSVGFYLLDNTGLLDYIFPEFCKLKGTEIIENVGHKDVFHHTLKVLDNISRETDNLWLRWAALLHDIAKPATKRFINSSWTFYGHENLGAIMIPKIFKRLRLPLNEKMKYVQKLVQLHLRPLVLADEGVTDSALRRLLFDAGDEAEDLIMLCEADITSTNDDKVRRYMSNMKKVKQRMKEIEEKDAIRNMQPPITGNEIMEIFGIAPSKNIGIIKDAIKDAILDGVIANNYDEAFNLMLEKARELGLEAVK